MLEATVRVFGSTIMFAWAFKRVLLPPVSLGPRELISVIFGISGCPLNILRFPTYCDCVVDNLETLSLKLFRSPNSPTEQSIRVKNRAMDQGYFIRSPL
jgi:hypothetical protein